jgi:hypothetical protein
MGVLLEQGLNIPEASKALGITRQRGHQIAKRFDLTSRKYLKLASSAVETTLKGEAVGQADPPKASTIIETAKMVYDRVQPAKSASDIPASVSFTQINLNISNGSSIQGI